MSEQKAEKDRVPTDGKETGQGTKPDAQPSEQPVIGQETTPDGRTADRKNENRAKGRCTVDAIDAIDESIGRNSR